MVVTEGVFSMDGDSPDILAMLQLCQQYAAPLLLDDAHGLGVLGNEGRGSAVAQGVANSELFCLMANFGKALGVSGAFLAGSNTVMDYLEQFGRHYIYSTGLSPAVCAAVIKSIELCRSQDWRRDKLHSNIRLFKQLAADLPLLASSTAIQGLVLGSSEQALNASTQLREAGVWLSAIRPPTVPKGSARLRITLSSHHNQHDIALLVKQLRLLI
jgi:8-amino-7-oxononanoate synthase